MTVHHIGWDKGGKDYVRLVVVGRDSTLNKVRIGTHNNLVKINQMLKKQEEQSTIGYIVWEWVESILIAVVISIIIILIELFIRHAITGRLYGQ